MKNIHPGLIAMATLRDGTYWFLPEHALAVVKDAMKYGLPLLGIDGAIVTPDWIKPSAADSWDYTSPSYPPVADRYLHAWQFIQDRANKGLHFEIVLDDD